MNATSRDEGLVRKVGPWGLAASIVGVAGMLAVIARGSWREITRLVTFIGISVLVYLVTSRPQAARVRSTKAGE